MAVEDWVKDSLAASPDLYRWHSDDEPSPLTRGLELLRAELIETGTLVSVGEERDAVCGGSLHADIPCEHGEIAPHDVVGEDQE
jgi:hypothetical protein